MNQENISRIEKLVRDVAPVYIDPERSINSSQLFDDLGFDSVGFIRLLMELEKEFSIQIQSEYLLPEYFDSVNKINDFIHKATNCD